MALCRTTAKNVGRLEPIRGADQFHDDCILPNQSDDLVRSQRQNLSLQTGASRFYYVLDSSGSYGLDFLLIAQHYNIAKPHAVALADQHKKIHRSNVSSCTFYRTASVQIPMAGSPGTS